MLQDIAQAHRIRSAAVAYWRTALRFTRTFPHIPILPIGSARAVLWQNQGSPKNFELAVTFQINITDFWRQLGTFRLSGSWLMDYVYTYRSADRCVSVPHIYMNIMVTMFIMRAVGTARRCKLYCLRITAWPDACGASLVAASVPGAQSFQAVHGAAHFHGDLRSWG